MTERTDRKYHPDMRTLVLAAISIFFWNLENFFDWKSDGLAYDTVFTARGERHWTYKRFRKKCSDAAKAILWCSGSMGSLPDIIGVAEIENRSVIQSLLRNTSLNKLDYDIVHFDSPDRRGIDVGLMYRRSRFKLLSARAVKVAAARGKDTLRTRDILVADLVTEDCCTLTVTVNHHPSKFGGGATAWRRKAALEALASIADSARRAGCVFVAMGDFNDTPDQPQYRRLCDSSGLANLALPLAEKGHGTIRYEGRWELIDHFYTPRGIQAEMSIMKIPFLVTRDNVHAGEKPLRTFVGPRYAGGVSDHLPIWLKLEL